MELKGSILPEIRGRLFLPRFSPKTLRKLNTTLLCDCVVRDFSPYQSRDRWKAIQVHSNDNSHKYNNNIQQQQPSVSVCTTQNSILPDLSFNRLQLSDLECCGVQNRGFAHFVARGAVLDEEYWTASWLRAEAHWESVSYMRHVDNYKRKYAEQEFYALKRRCAGRDGNSLECSCIVTVKKEDEDVKRTVLNSVVGTLDLSIRQFLQGETYPGEHKRYSAILASHEAYDAHKYAYIANLCVSKFARRQGIASNMLYLATDLATLAGMKQLFVHVNADNKPARDLYNKTGFEMVEAASSPLSKDQRLLMSMLL
ncbi:Acyl-CoA N-acyltransferases (NAT) superfamily protein [Thalictrum thalictroides]|uniref:Acyl-CoA N-acyltransferases (NAT) superfamily protein n=1 Tax=Thalictrum thalictroides TaxID=46969 RepID=A0A7J6VGK5_THATH|nr:Acyl-CoA N-acyltransferases (NAT) superfamily protein [Thalictrum thalictroides]